MDVEVADLAGGPDDGSGETSEARDLLGGSGRRGEQTKLSRNAPEDGTQIVNDAGFRPGQDGVDRLAEPGGVAREPDGRRRLPSVPAFACGPRWDFRPGRPNVCRLCNRRDAAVAAVAFPVARGDDEEDSTGLWVILPTITRLGLFSS